MTEHDLPQAAVDAAVHAAQRTRRSADLATQRLPGFEAVVMRAALAAARPHLEAAEITARRAEQDAIHADLGQMLEALGLGNYARPQSPREVMLECIAEAGRIRAAERDRIAAWLAETAEASPTAAQAAAREAIPSGPLADALAPVIASAIRSALCGAADLLRQAPGA